MDNRLLCSIKHLCQMIEIASMIKVVSQDKVFQKLVTIKLFIIVISYWIEPCLVFCSQDWYSVAAKVTARHSYNMPCRVVHHSSHHISQIGICISTRMMEFVYGKQCVVEFLVIQLLHGIPQSCMSTHEHFCTLLSEEFNESHFLVLLITYISKVKIRGNSPICEKTIRHEFCILERTSDTFLWNSHHYSFHSLVCKFVEGNKHQCPTLARSRWSLDQEKSFVACLVSLGLHFSHAQLIDSRRFACLQIFNIYYFIAFLFHTIIVF